MVYFCNIGDIIWYFQVLLVLGGGEILCSQLPGDRANHPHHGDGQVRRGRALENKLLDFSAAELDPVTGLKCLRIENETVASVERERLLSCTHSSINICHFTYVTRFKSSRQRVCDEIYTKNCNIVFNKVQPDNIGTGGFVPPRHRRRAANEDE